MKKIIHQGFDFSQLGGFPLNQQRLEWMQTAYAELSGGLAAMFGDNVIVSGCIVSGQSVSDGWIVVNGELLPFVGSQTGVLDTFLIREDTTALTFKDGANKNVQFRRYAQFGTSNDAIAWSSLKRMASYTNISAHIARTDNPHGVTKSQVGLGNIPNAITNDPNISDSDILATSKMVNTAVSNANRIIYTGRVQLDPSTNGIDITLPQKLADVSKTHLLVDIYMHIHEDSPYIRTLYMYRPDYLSFVRINDDNQENFTKITVVYNKDMMNQGGTYYCVYTLMKID